jgi:alkylhydroperoxidase family enzyme
MKMSRVAPALIEGNAVQSSLLARVMGRRPDVLKAFGRLDTVLRFRGLLPMDLLEAVRRATAGEVGCRYCASLGEPRTDIADSRTAVAVAFAELVVQGPSEITDEQFDVLREEFDEDEIVELVAYICLVSIAGQMFGAVMALEEAEPDEAAAYQAALTEHGGH